MKQHISAIMICVVACFFATGVWAQSNSAFDKLKALEGDWEGVRYDDQAVELSYRLMSNGSALVETLKSANEPSMVTVYHLNGDKVMMTHYCSVGNQPRMVANGSSGSQNEINFEFLDVTNMKSSSDGHMVGLKFIFEDQDHFKQVWTWSEGDKQAPGTFEFKRRKV